MSEKKKSSAAAKVLALLVIILGAIAAYSSYTAFVAQPSGPMPTAPTKIEYVIGMPQAVSGPYATEGPFRRDAASLAIADINSMLEKSGSPVRFKGIFEDSKGTAEGALAAVQSLYSAGARVMVGPFSTGEVRGVASFANSNKAVIISPSSTGAAMAGRSRDFIVRAVAPDTFQARALAQTISEMGYAKVAVIGRGDDYGRGIADLFEKTFTDRYKGQVRKLLYTPGQPDYGAEVQRLASFVRDLGADQKTAVLIIAFDDDGLNIINNARLDPALSKVQWFGSESMKRPTYLPPKAPAEVGAFLTNARMTGLFPVQIAKNPVTLQFEKAYKDRFGKDPSPYAYYTYDSVWLAALSILACGKYDAECVRSVIPSVADKYIGASGYKQLDASGDVQSGDYEIWQMTKTGDTYAFKRIGAWFGATEQVQMMAKGT